LGSCWIKNWALSSMFSSVFSSAQMGGASGKSSMDSKDDTPGGDFARRHADSTDDTKQQTMGHDELCKVVRRLEKSIESLGCDMKNLQEAIEEFQFGSKAHALALSKLNKDLVCVHSCLGEAGFKLEPCKMVEESYLKSSAHKLALEKLNKDIQALGRSLYNTDTGLDPAASQSGSGTVYTHATANSTLHKTSCSVNSAVEALSIELKNGLQELHRQCDNEMKARIQGDKDLQRQCDNEVKDRMHGDEEMKLVVLELLNKNIHEMNGNSSV